MAELANKDIDSQTGWSRAVVDQILRSIKIARTVEKRSWAVMNVDSEVHLNTGQRNAIEMSSTQVILLIDHKYFSLDELSPTTELLDWRDENEEKFPRLRKVRFSIIKSRREIRKMRLGHEMAVRAVSEKKTAFFDRHSPKIVSELERIAGVEFPKLGM